MTRAGAQAGVDVQWSGAAGLAWWASPAGWAGPHAGVGATRAAAGAVARAGALPGFRRLALALSSRSSRSRTGGLSNIVYQQKRR